MVLTFSENKNAELRILKGLNKEEKSISDRTKHAVLVKKNGEDNFAFYDPNFGAIFNLKEEQLLEIVAQVFFSYKEISLMKLNMFLIVLSASIAASLFAMAYSYIMGVVVLFAGITFCMFLLSKISIEKSRYSMITPDVIQSSHNKEPEVDNNTPVESIIKQSDDTENKSSVPCTFMEQAPNLEQLKECPVNCER